ncbi:hypothetical protein [Blautia sp.]|uniref:rolling circle replication-associated protein n=1 Tax=Blautia sp. TaxID=1955243 RepID=UPI0039965086
MSGYNVRAVHYPGGLQIRVYNKTIFVDERVKLARIEEKEEMPKSSDVRTFEQEEHSNRVSINRTVNTVYELARANTWSYFLTLTINPALIDNTLDNYDMFTKTIRKYLNNLKTNYAPDLKYLIVPELHKDGKKIHFHALIADVGNIKFEFSGKVSAGKYIYDIDKCRWGKKIYNMPLWKFGWSTATIVQDNNKVAGYICKYITKDLLAVTKNKRRFWSSLNLDRADIRYFNVSYNDLISIFHDYENSILYTKKIKIEQAGLDISYFEFDQNIPLEDLPQKEMYADEYDNPVSQDKLKEMREEIKMSHEKFRQKVNEYRNKEYEEYLRLAQFLFEKQR